MKPTEKDYTEQMRQLNEEWQQVVNDMKDITICKCCSWICANCEVEHCEFDGGGKCPTLKSLREYMER